MKPMILVAFCALSLHVTAADTKPQGGDQAQAIGFQAPTDEEATSIPEAGAVVLGLVGAMMLLRRRR